MTQNDASSDGTDKAGKRENLFSQTALQILTARHKRSQIGCTRISGYPFFKIPRSIW